MKKLKIHVYPPYKGTKANPGNLYSKLLWGSFEKDDNFLLSNHCLSGKPLWDMPCNIDADVFLFSWIEGMANTLFGKFKLLYVFAFLTLMRLLKKDVVWILHNKHPHSKETRSSKAAMEVLTKLASHVVTHAKEGVSYFEENLKGRKGKCSYIPHPVYDTRIHPASALKWDFIIWGGISPRKGIAEFLEYTSGDPFFKDKKILICGRCVDDRYAKWIELNCGVNIKFINDFIPDGNLEEYISESRYILFTYHESSILSSGALVYSLNFCKPILGPKAGSFMDIPGVVTCYEGFKDIANLQPRIDENALKDYLRDNTWDNFPQKIFNIISDENTVI